MDIIKFIIRFFLRFLFANEIKNVTEVEECFYRLSNHTSLLSTMSEPSVSTTKHNPVLLWHGMGDSYNSHAMQCLANTIEKTHPGIEIHSIYIEEDGSDDKSASVWGDALTQIGKVCDQIKNLPYDEDTVFNGMGFSQGGLFIRSLVQTCDIKFNNVITVGSPQNGFADLPECEPDNMMCKTRNKLIKNSLYTDYMQNNNIQAQYFRDVEQYDTYIEKSAYLKYVNNELFKDLVYYERLTALNKFVMILFDQDETLVPKETAWFYDIDKVTGELIPFNQTESYKDDLLGLRKLDKENKVDFLSIDDLHLRLSEDDVIYLAKTYL